MTFRTIGFLIAVLWATAAFAQTGTPASYVLRVYQPGTPTLIGTPLTVQASQVQCNQPKPPPTATNVNPRVWRWNDHDATHVNMDCVFDDATRLTALPDGAYESTVQPQNSDGSATEGARAPFSRRRANPPAAVTNPRMSTD